MALGRVGVRFAVGVVWSESAEQEKTKALIGMAPSAIFRIGRPVSIMGQQQVCRAHGC